jgi:hypothetical protein
MRAWTLKVISHDMVRGTLLTGADFSVRLGEHTQPSERETRERDWKIQSDVRHAAELVKAIAAAEPPANTSPSARPRWLRARQSTRTARKPTRIA